MSETANENTEAANPPRRTPAQSVQVWADLMDTCHEFLLAGLRRKIGPEGDLAAAYQAWYAKRMEEHDAMIMRIAQHFGKMKANDDE